MEAHTSLFLSLSLSLSFIYVYSLPLVPLLLSNLASVVVIPSNVVSLKGETPPPLQKKGWEKKKNSSAFQIFSLSVTRLWPCFAAELLLEPFNPLKDILLVRSK